MQCSLAIALVAILGLDTYPARQPGNADKVLKLVRSRRV